MPATEWIWQGNCINTFDEDGTSLLPIFSDVSAFAVAEESAVPFCLPSGDALQSPPEVPKELEFSFDEGTGVLMGYDAANDIHHFFIREQSQQHFSRPSRMRT